MNVLSQEFLSYVVDPDMVITDRANHITSRRLTDHLWVAQFACYNIVILLFKRRFAQQMVVLHRIFSMFVQYLVHVWVGVEVYIGLLAAKLIVTCQ